MISANDDMQQAQEIRYADCLAAMIDCINKGVSVKTLETLKFEMAIDARDYQRIMDYCLSKKFAGFIK